MKTKILFGFFIMAFCLSIASAVEVNYSTATEGTTVQPQIQIEQLKYEPYPVNPGEYFDLWIKAQNIGTTSTTNATFELMPEFPFSLDSNENATRVYGKLGQDEVVLKYKVRISKDAVEGTNELKLRYNSDGKDVYWIYKTFDIEVANAQTDFEVVVQEISGADLTIAIANIGKNIANSVVVKIPEQEHYIASGTSGQMVGNLENGDYTIVAFTITEKMGKAEPNSEKTLKVQVDYTDNIGERRNVTKEVTLESDLIQSFANKQTIANRTSNSSSNLFTDPSFLIPSSLLVVGIGIYFIYKKIKTKKK